MSQTIVGAFTTADLTPKLCDDLCTQNKDDKTPHNKLLVVFTTGQKSSTISGCAGSAFESKAGKR